MKVRPKLVVTGADDALAFYEQVLGARPVVRYTVGGAVVLAELELHGGDTLQVKDADEHDPAPQDRAVGVVLDVLCEDPDAVMARAVRHGAVPVFEVADQPYGSRQGRFRDPFGHEWIVGTPVTMTAAQVQAALDAWAAPS